MFDGLVACTMPQTDRQMDIHDLQAKYFLGLCQECLVTIKMKIHQDPQGTWFMTLLHSFSFEHIPSSGTCCRVHFVGVTALRRQLRCAKGKMILSSGDTSQSADMLGTEQR
jgi:hypothetical protein